MEEIVLRQQTHARHAWQSLVTWSGKFRFLTNFRHSTWQEFEIRLVVSNIKPLEANLPEARTARNSLSVRLDIGLLVRALFTPVILCTEVFTTCSPWTSTKITHHTRHWGMSWRRAHTKWAASCLWWTPVVIHVMLLFPAPRGECISRLPAHTESVFLLYTLPLSLALFCGLSLLMHVNMFFFQEIKT